MSHVYSGSQPSDGICRIRDSGFRMVYTLRTNKCQKHRVRLAVWLPYLHHSLIIVKIHQKASRLPSVVALHDLGDSLPSLSCAEFS